MRLLSEAVPVLVRGFVAKVNRESRRETTGPSVLTNAPGCNPRRCRLDLATDRAGGPKPVFESLFENFRGDTPIEHRAEPESRGLEQPVFVLGGRLFLSAFLGWLFRRCFFVKRFENRVAVGVEAAQFFDAPLGRFKVFVASL